MCPVVAADAARQSAEDREVTIKPHKPMWERACSRWRWFSQDVYRLLLRYREQARSHRGGVLQCC
ncbi:hypothetical protein F0169_05175 [Pseudomonas sp. MAFF 212408]|uniref:Uncharacterized protein n=1 Tax=Pseudomonas kitaguniensis TaxID=2607908 RepID=A0A5N7KHJ2_9PSED|nr:hypothetical protein [Pseudomonas kitaguniensis]